MRTRLFVGGVVSLAIINSAQAAGPAQIGLSASTLPKVIIGAQIPVQALVSNQAAPGSNDLNYSIDYVLPGFYSFHGTGTRAADGGAGSDQWVRFIDTSNLSPGEHDVTVTVSDPAAQPASSLGQPVAINVLNHAMPGMWINGKLATPASPATEPSVDPLAFGATGGGESFAAGAPNVIGDPPLSIPTAELDLDSITLTGDSQISITLHSYIDELPNDDPTAGVPWQILVDGSTPGTYHADVDAAFSDEQDLAGADAVGSIHWHWAIDVTVLPGGGGVTGTLTAFSAPEPGSLALLMIGGGVMMRRGRRACRHCPKNSGPSPR